MLWAWTKALLVSCGEQSLLLVCCSADMQTVKCSQLRYSNVTINRWDRCTLIYCTHWALQIAKNTMSMHYWYPTANKVFFFSCHICFSADMQTVKCSQLRFSTKVTINRWDRWTLIYCINLSLLTTFLLLLIRLILIDILRVNAPYFFPNRTFVTTSP